VDLAESTTLISREKLKPEFFLDTSRFAIETFNAKHSHSWVHRCSRCSLWCCVFCFLCYKKIWSHSSRVCSSCSARAKSCGSSRFVRIWYIRSFLLSLFCSLIEMFSLIHTGFPGPVNDIATRHVLISSFDRRTRNPSWVSLQPIYDSPVLKSAVRTGRGTHHPGITGNETWRPQAQSIR